MADTAAAKTAAEHSQPPDAPELTAHEKKKAFEEESLSASITYDVIRVEGEKQLLRTSSALAWSGLAAGLVMGFSMVGEGLLKAHLPEASWAPHRLWPPLGSPAARGWPGAAAVHPAASRIA